jgi:protein-tyrosine kinase
MSKIEKALSRAQEARGNLQLITVAREGVSRAPGAVVRTESSAHPETISLMARNEVRLLNPDELAQRGMIQLQHSEDPAIQVFRELRTKIIQQNRGRNAVILVTSVSKGCGGSFIARNLGAAFAFDMGKTALLMDCNLADPSAHKLLAKPSTPGLVDYFENPNLDIKEIIHPLGIARYRVITAGKQRDVLEEHFTSEKMNRLVDTLRRRYQERFIIMDGPPMSKIADIRVLSDLADYVLLVARYARSTNTQIGRCLELISEKKQLGVVFNDEPRFPRFR